MDHPTEKLVEKYLDKFNQDSRYSPADKAILKLFEAFPGNSKIEDILLKISVINDLYSTNIFGTFKMAQHIQKLNIDAMLSLGNPSAVRLIASGHGIRAKKTNKEIIFYSFATKYCNWHNREKYAIYDSYVEKVLWAYKKKDNFSEFKKPDFKDFESFLLIINQFVSFYQLSKYDLKEVDKFLWIYGKELFTSNYS